MMKKKIQKQLKKQRKIALFFLVIMLLNIVSPVVSFALTSGPNQPEFQSFVPVGSSDMVDMFSGDFKYNIPLMDVDGYPINLAYHNVANADEESSWVGLGWNLNLGEIQRSVRGLPDDFNGEVIQKHKHVLPERDLKLDIGINLEIFGLNVEKAAKKILKKMKVPISIYFGNNNYNGNYGGFGTGFSCTVGPVSPGVSLDFSSNNGVGVNTQISYSQQIENKDIQGWGVSGGLGFNSRRGYGELSLTGSLVAKVDKISKNENSSKNDDDNSKKVTDSKDDDSKSDKDKKDEKSFGQISGQLTGKIPIGISNFVPTITNRTKTNGWTFGVKIPGIKLPLGFLGDLAVHLSKNKIKTFPDETLKSYGYLNLGNASDGDLVDFNRENAGTFNKYMPNLPLASLNYDLFSVNGQGVGGTIRPVRNDLGVVNDPERIDKNESENWGGNIEIGIGGFAELGFDVSYTNVKQEHTKLNGGKMPNKFGNVYNENYKSENQNYNGLIEPYYFKQAGEMTSPGMGYYNGIGGSGANDIMSFNKRNTSIREPRGEMAYMYTTKEAQRPDFSYLKYIENYPNNGWGGPPININKDANNRSEHFISEFTKVTTNGEKYIYGIPAMNNVTKEVTMAVNETAPKNLQTGLCRFTTKEKSDTNSSGRDNLFQYTLTPAYAHSYLLSAIVSPDYSDLTGDGLTDDDFGKYVKFNYSLKSTDYRWRFPYSKLGQDSAFYDAGYNVDPYDNKASYTIGSKELWYAHSIETKNMICEFYTSKKDDGQGSDDVVDGYTNTPTNNSTFKLDSIKLYNKNEKLLNGINAMPIKVIYLQYDYSLCKNTPNSNDVQHGKLTLNRIFIKYGNSDKNLMSPYVFNYSSFNPDYNPATKNRWGTFKPLDDLTPNHLFPYINQSDTRTNLDLYATAWQLSEIKLPSGGNIKVTYEADDYAFVQDKRASEMVKVVGINNSPNLSTNAKLYSGNGGDDDDNSKNSNNLYIILQKKQGAFFTNDLKKLYTDNDKTIYFNFAVDIINKAFNNVNNFDQVRGYAEIETVGQCSDPNYVYIKIKPKNFEKGKGSINPITYTALNVGRKDLSNMLYPGTDPENQGIASVMNGIYFSMKELVNSIFAVNPLKPLLRKGKAQNINLDRSFVRISTPSLKKVGGGCRVKRVELNDNWDKLIGGEPNASYGNEYDYTIHDDTYGDISSGVASWEPSVGGDENSQRGVNDYKIMKGAGYPRVEPITEIQQTPLGESLYPCPTVGYSKVVVKSIHAPYARSAQASVEYGFYTAKDFPLRLEKTEMLTKKVWRPYVIRNENSFYAKQAFSLVMNDMHGKPKYVKNLAQKTPNATYQKETVSSIEYTYQTKDNHLDNNVKTLTCNDVGVVTPGTSELGKEIDITLDSRYARTRVFSASVDLNTHWEIPFLVVPTAIPWVQWDIKKFGSYTTTKIVQEYGVLANTVATINGAVIKTINEYFNPETGDVLVKSIENEFGDLKYETSFPASWAYKGMSQTYKNIFYNGSFSGVTNDNYNNRGVIPSLTAEQRATLCDGDELWIEPSSGGGFKAWFQFDSTMCLGGLLYKRDATTSPNFTSSMNFQVVRSGRKNQLGNSIVNAVTKSNPITGAISDFYIPNNVINITNSTYSDSNVLRIPYNNPYDPTYNHHFNPFVFGYLGNYRPFKNYVYSTNRNYTADNARVNGTYNITSKFWSVISTTSRCDTTHIPDCPRSDNGYYNYNYDSCKKAMATAMANMVYATKLVVGPQSHIDDPSSVWKADKKGVWYTPWGAEVQNTDALGIVSAAQFGYANGAATAVANNVETYNSFFFDGFEDYKHLFKSNIIANAFKLNSSPFKSNFASSVSVGTTNYNNINSFLTTGIQLSTIAHSGKFSLKMPKDSFSFMINNGSAYLDNANTKNASLTYNSILLPNKKYIFSVWLKSDGINNLPANILINVNTNNYFITPKTNVIDGWVKYEGSFTTDATSGATFHLPPNCYLDDCRFYPNQANMKSFVYNYLNNQLMATLDENNFATFFEYDKEGTLIRVKKESEKGILTLQENRSSQKK